MRRFIATITYILAILLVNAAFVYLPSLSAFGESFSAADIVVGLIYIVRDFAQREIKHYVIVAMLIGCGLSYWLADKTIALASVTAFAVGESIDWAIFTFTQKPLSQRLLLSSMASAPIDTYVFLGVSHQLNFVGFTIMTLGKFTGILLVWLAWRWQIRAYAPSQAVPS